MKPNQREADRFNERYKKCGKRSCWEWLGKRGKNGYGLFYMIRPPRKTFHAHRVAWAMHNDRDIPDGMMICHTCDNRGCVNPAHLYLGTGYDNNSDTVKRNRANRKIGSECSWSKLTEENVRHIINSNQKQRVLAERYGIDQSTVSQIKAGLRWKHLHRKQLVDKTV